MENKNHRSSKKPNQDKSHFCELFLKEHSPAEKYIILSTKGLLLLLLVSWVFLF